MFVFKLTNILFVLWSCRTSALDVQYDMTDVLNLVMVGNLSIEEFAINLKLYEYVRENQSATVFGLFAPDCNDIWECGDQLNDTVQIMHESREQITQNLDIVLQFKFRIDINTLTNLKMPLSHKKLRLPAGNYWVYLTLSNDATCDDLKDITATQWTLLVNSSTWFSEDTTNNIIRVGFGYNENLIDCDKLYHVISLSSYLLTSMSFGKTPGVVESFGLFKKRVVALHTQNIMFIQDLLRSDYTEPAIDYYVISESLGDDFHRHLLYYYWQAFETRDGYKMYPIVPMLLLKKKLPPPFQMQVIPSIDAKSCLHEDDIPWYAPTALSALSKHFKSVVLTHVEWKMLHSNYARNYYRVVNRTSDNLDIRLSLIIDYTDWLETRQLTPTLKGCHYNWTVLEPTKQLRYPLQNVSVTQLVFSVTALTTEKYTVNVNRGYAKRMALQLTIGCGFQSNSFGALSDTTAGGIVAACKEINGSVYSLQSRLQLESIIQLNWINSRHFENDVRPKLEEMKLFRQNLLTYHPEATVYFQLRFNMKISNNHATAFCNREALSLNENIEGIVNWATLNEIPLIIGRAFDDINHRKYPTWFSVLRPKVPVFKNINPYLVVRDNTPELDIDIEPCVEWTMEIPILTPNYFNNNYVGTIVDTAPFPTDNPISKDEYKVLLQFVFNRFDIVEAVVKNESYQDFLEALSTFDSDELIGLGKKILVDFVPPDINSEAKLRRFQTFLNLTKEVLVTDNSHLKGISFASGSFRVTNNKNKKQALELTTQRNIEILSWGRSLNLKMGVAMFTSDCQEAVLSSILSVNNSLHTTLQNVLNAAGYLICVEFVKLNRYNNQKVLGELFDTHLYVKKVVKDFYPHLDLYFRVTVEETLTEKTLNKYLILISRFKKFGTNYNISYIMVNAFDEGFTKENGWWKISNFSNLAEPSVYEERYSAYNGFQTWRPSTNSKPNANEGDTKPSNLFFVLIVSGLLLLIAILGLGLWYYKNKASSYLSSTDENEFRNGRQGNVEDQSSGVPEYLKFDNKYEMALADIFFDPKDLLGRGNFGTVYKGLVKDEPAAIKRPNENCSAISFKSVLSEVKVLCYIGTHSNVVRCIGAYTKEIRKGILYIATELCSNGSLHDFLRSKKRVIINLKDLGNLSPEKDDDDVYSYELHQFSKEIGRGMEYIVEKNIIHGDLSARNVLLDENFTCKIGDFGLSRKLYEYLEYVKTSQEPLPWKWMSYESLKDMKFTSKSDVWSYGVTIWEIYSLGGVPYGALCFTPAFTEDLKNGLRLQMPEHATEEIYKLMSNCWKLDADERPTFTAIVDFFKKLTSCQYTVLEL